MEVSSQSLSSTLAPLSVPANEKEEKDSANSFNHMGNALRQQGDMKAAINAYKKAIMINPNYADALNNIGSVLKEMGHVAEALEAYKQALKIEPNCAQTYSDIGAAFIEIGNTEVAIEAYKQALKIQPNHVGTQHILAELTEQKKISAITE